MADRAASRAAVAAHVEDFSLHSHTWMTAEFRALGLPDPSEGSKRERVEACLEGLSDDELPAVAGRILDREPQPATRNVLQDLLWADRTDKPALSRKTRRAIAASLDVEELFLDLRGFMALLERLWVLDAPDPTAGPSSSFLIPSRTLREGIAQHVGRNKDWSALEFFDYPDALTPPHRPHPAQEGRAPPLTSMLQIRSLR